MRLIRWGIDPAVTFEGFIMASYVIWSGAKLRRQSGLLDCSFEALLAFEGVHGGLSSAITADNEEHLLELLLAVEYETDVKLSWHAIDTRAEPVAEPATEQGDALALDAEFSRAGALVSIDNAERFFELLLPVAWDQDIRIQWRTVSPQVK